MPHSHKKKPAGLAPSGPSHFVPISAQRSQALGQPRQLASGRILVDDTLRDAPRQLRLNLAERSLCLIFVAGFERGFGLLDEGADAADARAVDFCPARIAAD